MGANLMLIELCVYTKLFFNRNSQKHHSTCILDCLVFVIRSLICTTHRDYPVLVRTTVSESRIIDARTYTKLFFNI